MSEVGKNMHETIPVLSGIRNTDDMDEAAAATTRDYGGLSREGYRLSNDVEYLGEDAACDVASEELNASD